MPTPSPSSGQRSPPSIAAGANVRSQDGLHGRVVSETGSSDDKRVLVRVDDGRHLLLSADFLEVAADGDFFVPLDLATADPDRPEVIPVIEEQLEVGKRLVVGGGVRVSKTVTEHTQTIDEPLAKDRLVVERVPLHRPVSREAPPTIRQEGETVVIPLLQEAVVVEKRLVLVEEVRVTRLREEAHEPQDVVLKREEVSIERIDEQGRTLGPDQSDERPARARGADGTAVHISQDRSKS
jgi:uncharacterized protein (TIGR02271 family)